MIPFKGLPSVQLVQRQFESLLGISKFQFNYVWDKILTMMTKNIEIDILKLDEFLDHNDPDYDAEECTYKGNNTSMIDYITEKFGKEANDLIERLINYP